MELTDFTIIDWIDFADADDDGSDILLVGVQDGTVFVARDGFCRCCGSDDAYYDVQGVTSLFALEGIVRRIYTDVNDAFGADVTDAEVTDLINSAAPYLA